MWGTGGVCLICPQHMSDKPLTRAWLGEQVWSRLEERKGQLGLAQYQERQQGQEVLVQPRKGKEGCLCEACGLVLRILLSSAGTPAPLLLRLGIHVLRLPLC